MSGRRELTIVQLNDSHGYLDAHQEMFWHGNHAVYRKTGGFGRVAAVINEIREHKPGRVLALDCGDTIHGTYEVVESSGQALVPILNEIGFDAMTAHWEFAYGPQRLREISRQLDYPLLAINCYDERTDELAFDPYVVREVGGLRVGIIGIAATIVDKVMPPHFSEGLRFTLGNRELPGWISRLRKDEDVDLVVVLSHLGFAQEVKLAREVDGIDVLLSGHTHNRLYRPAVINETILIQSGCHGSFLGRLDLQVEGGRVVDCNHELLTLEERIVPDPEVQRMVKEHLAPHGKRLSQVLGRTATDLNRGTVLESTMDNFLLQGLLNITGAEMAFSNGWRYGAPIPPGPITLNDLYNIIPVDPPVSTCTLTGEELWNMMEENLERTFARDPYEQQGGYVKRCMGLNLYFKVENPFGQRIQELFVKGERVRPDREYDAAFVTTQGVPAMYGSRRQELDIRAVEALQRYLEESGSKPVEASLRGTVVAV
ncbi:MAG: bifunctional metallophosphatase/5'-nucleotidase [Candidatus Aegiribacteria sp.]